MEMTTQADPARALFSAGPEPVRAGVTAADDAGRVPPFATALADAHSERRAPTSESRITKRVDDRSDADDAAVADSPTAGEAGQGGGSALPHMREVLPLEGAGSSAADASDAIASALDEAAAADELEVMDASSDEARAGALAAATVATASANDAEAPSVDAESGVALEEATLAPEARAPRRDPVGDAAAEDRRATVRGAGRSAVPDVAPTDAGARAEAHGASSTLASSVPSPNGALASPFAAAPASAAATTTQSASTVTMQASAQSLPAAHGPEFSGAVGERIDVLLAQRGGRMELRLSPAHLGSLEIEVTVGEEGTRISLVAAQAAARDALDAALPRLREQFQGAAELAIEVGIGQPDAGDGRGPGDDEDRSRTAEGMTAAAAEHEGVDGSGELRRTALHLARSALDIYA